MEGGEKISTLETRVARITAAATAAPRPPAGSHPVPAEDTGMEETGGGGGEGEDEGHRHDSRLEGNADHQGGHEPACARQQVEYLASFLKPLAKVRGQRSKFTLLLMSSGS